MLITIIMLILLFLFNSNANNEHYSNEAIENIASLYDKKNMIVENLTVTGKATLSSAKIGNWEMRGDKLGIPARADISNDGDGYMRIYDYDKETYHNLAVSDLWENTGTAGLLSNKYTSLDQTYRISTSDNYRVISQPFGGMQLLRWDVPGGNPGIPVKLVQIK
jgi:hypothetical protein